MAQPKRKLLGILTIIIPTVVLLQIWGVKATAAKFRTIPANASTLQSDLHTGILQMVQNFGRSHQHVKCSALSDNPTKTKKSFTHIAAFPWEKTCDIGLSLPSPKPGKEIAEHFFQSGFEEHTLPKRTPLWSQELIGADLARDLVLQAQDKITRNPIIGVYDQGFGMIENSPGIPHGLMTQSALSLSLTGVQPLKNPQPTAPSPSEHLRLYTEALNEHGELVTHLILGVKPVGVCERCQLSFLVDATPDIQRTMNKGTSPAGFASLSQLASNDIVNASMDLSGSARKDFKRSFVGGIERPIWVIAAGNSGNLDMDPWLISLKQSVVTVGSLSCYGAPAGHSQDAKTLSIYAPVETGVVSVANHGYYTIDGTSAAAPLVSGALANAVAFMGKLSAEEANQLLRKTAVIVPASKTNGNGAGMLNAYQLAKVAIRAHEKGFPNWDSTKPLDKEKRKEILNDPALFDFSQEADALLNKADNLAQMTHAHSRTKCDIQKEIFDSIRASFLLNQNEPARQALIKAYQVAEFPLNAAFYRSLGDQDEQLAVLEEFSNPGINYVTKDDNLARAINNFERSYPQTPNMAKLKAIETKLNLTPEMSRFFNAQRNQTTTAQVQLSAVNLQTKSKEIAQIIEQFYKMESLPKRRKGGNATKGNQQNSGGILPKNNPKEILFQQINTVTSPDLAAHILSAAPARCAKEFLDWKYHDLNLVTPEEIRWLVDVAHTVSTDIENNNQSLKAGIGNINANQEHTERMLQSCIMKILSSTQIANPQHFVTLWNHLDKKDQLKFLPKNFSSQWSVKEALSAIQNNFDALKQLNSSAQTNNTNAVLLKSQLRQIDLISQVLNNKSQHDRALITTAIQKEMQADPGTSQLLAHAFEQNILKSGDQKTLCQNAQAFLLLFSGSHIHLDDQIRGSILLFVRSPYWPRDSIENRSCGSTYENFAAGNLLKDPRS